MEVLSLSLFLFLSPLESREREREANRTVTVELGRGLVLQNNPGQLCFCFFSEFTQSVIFSAMYLVICCIFFPVRQLSPHRWRFILTVKVRI